MKVYYINLDHRTDRKQHIEEQLKNQGITDYERINAVYVPYFGALGCTFSHIKTLEKFINEDEEHEVCVIFEDDFIFTRDFSEFKFPDFDWDVIMLSGNVLESREHSDGFKKVIDAQTTSGYIVHKKFAPVLLKNFHEGKEMLIKTRVREKFSLDMYWKILQPVSNWYVCDPKFGVQVPSYSDIENWFSNYGV